jgi:hypothetical protein
MKRSAIATLVLLIAGAFARAQGNVCTVPDQMTKEQKLPCVKAGKFMVDQPTLTAEQLANGPDFDAAAADKTRFKYFTNDDNVLCYFRPHYAFMKVKGDSMKFQCWHMVGRGIFYGTNGEQIAVDGVRVVVKPAKDGEPSVTLYASNDTNNQNDLKVDHFKVKYLKPPFPNHNTRFNEVFTEVAASRIMWVLGFPADHVYPVGSIACIGCGDDPFTSDLKGNTASLKDTPTVFKVVSAEREVPWVTIQPEGDETWEWGDAAKFYSDGTWTHEQKVEYDAYRLALGLIHYHNAIAQQNRLSCAEWAPKVQGQPRVCKQPMIYVQDLGSTFGKAKGTLDVFGQNPRGSYSDWETQTVFSNLETCELRATMDGDRQVLKDAQDLMIQRLMRLDAPTVQAIFQTARFQMMDQKQLQKLRQEGSANAEEAALDQWTNTFLKRIEEIRTVKNCRVKD